MENKALTQQKSQSEEVFEALQQRDRMIQDFQIENQQLKSIAFDTTGQATTHLEDRIKQM